LRGRVGDLEAAGHRPPGPADRPRPQHLPATGRFEEVRHRPRPDLPVPALQPPRRLLPRRLRLRWRGDPHFHRRGTPIAPNAANSTTATPGRTADTPTPTTCRPCPSGTTTRNTTPAGTHDDYPTGRPNGPARTGTSTANRPRPIPSTEPSTHPKLPSTTTGHRMLIRRRSDLKPRRGRERLAGRPWSERRRTVLPVDRSEDSEKAVRLAVGPGAEPNRVRAAGDGVTDDQSPQSVDHDGVVALVLQRALEVAGA
jgi:hypothetical protein